MRCIASALEHIHDLRIVHGDLKPSHVLLGGSPKLFGMDGSRRLAANESSLPPNATGTLGWRSPEQILHLPQTLATDVFSLGCLLFFILTRGKHLFGNDPLEREINMTSNNKLNLTPMEHISEATNFFSRGLNFKPELRPKALDVLADPMLWDSEMRINFILETRKLAPLLKN